MGNRLAAAFVFVTLVAVAASSAAMPTPAEKGYLIVYQQGRYVGMRADKMQAEDAWARSGGHMPRRRDPLWVAEVDAAKAFPEQARLRGKPRHELRAGLPAAIMKRLLWRLIGQHDGKAAVRVFVRGQLHGGIRLAQPFGYWWYVTSVRRIGVPRSHVILVHPDGAREFLRGPVVIRDRRAYLPLRDLRRVNVESQWDPARQAARVHLPDSDFILWLRAGRRLVEGRGPQLFRKNLEWKPFMRRGEMYVSAAGVARDFPTFLPVWNRRSGRLDIYATPLRKSPPG